jgi:hypothetical protein
LEPRIAGFTDRDGEGRNGYLPNRRDFPWWAMIAVLIDGAP